jgi:hypothetical protein
MPVVLNANALITEAELELMLGGISLDSDTANTLINIASDRIKSYIGFDLVQTTYTDEVYSGNGRFKLFLRKYPIITVTAVKVWDTYNNVLDETLTVNEDYMLFLSEGYLFMRGGWYKGVSNFKITYSAGYAVIPYDIRFACAQLCGMYLDSAGSANKKSESIGQYSYTNESGTGNNNTGEIGMPPAIAGVLNKYRCPIVADDR